MNTKLIFRSVTIAVLLTLILSVFVSAFTLVRIADNSNSGCAIGGDNFNRAVGYVQDTGLFYAYGGGSLGSGSYCDDLWAWTESTDSWANTGDDMPVGERFNQRAFGASATKLAGVGAGSGCDVVIYDALSGVWDTSAVDPPMGCGFGISGTVIGNELWVCGVPSTGIPPAECASLNINNPGVGWTARSSIVGATVLQHSALIYDPDNDRILTFDQNEDTFVYQFSTGMWTEITGATFPFTAHTDVDIAFFDNAGGVIIGEMSNPAPGSLRTYQFVYNESDITLSDWALYQTWSEGAFSSCADCLVWVGDTYTVTTEQQQTRFVFGGGITTVASPSGNAALWWEYNGEAPIIPSDLSGTIDTWIINFLEDFLGLNSPAGKIMFAVGLLMVIGVGLIYIGLPPLIVIALNVFGLLLTILATLLGPEIMLATIAVGGIAAVLMFVVGRGGERSGE